MNTQIRLSLIVVSAAALSLSTVPTPAQVFDAADAAKNRAVAASPRAKESFPWLTRQTIERASVAKSPESSAAITEATRNRGLAASPRAVEEFPELARPVQPLRQPGRNSFASRALQNSALAASPRMIEEFPAVARGRAAASQEKVFEIAPLK